MQARLDEETQVRLGKIVRRLGWNSSEVVREGIRLVEERHLAPRRQKWIGVGEHDSGISDLSTNNKHMEDFGK
ncbi:MAG TPA: hypothetical protein VGJ21_06205 [Terracidiphilus sp.]